MGLGLGLRSIGALDREGREGAGKKGWRQGLRKGVWNERGALGFASMGASG